MLMSFVVRSTHYNTTYPRATLYRTERSRGVLSDCRDERGWRVPVRLDGSGIARVHFALRSTVGAEASRRCG